MTSSELRKKFLEFFEERGHKVIPSSSLVPENDPSVLFTTAGMHPLVPYLLGEKHPLGNRLSDVQKCLRTDDIDEVGDASHLTFFEMLGYWSLGDYFKKESIHYTFGFYTEVLGFNMDDISVSVFAGDDTAPFDQESFDTWKNEIGIPEERIYKYGRKENWWGPVGATGPCGPDTEMFIDTGIDACGPDCGPSCNCDKFIEIGNNVFMEFNKISDTEYEPLTQKNVDVGLGLERLAMFSQGKTDVFQIDAFEPIIKKIEELSGKTYQGNEKAFRIIADHLRAATFAIADGAIPSNKDRGYITRRLIRRAVRYGNVIGITQNFASQIGKEISSVFSQVYSGLDADNTIEQLNLEEDKFRKTLEDGIKKAEIIFGKKQPISQDDYARIMQLGDKGEILKKIYHDSPEKKSLIEYGINISDQEVKSAYVTGEEAFNLFQTYGFPKEMIIELAQAKCLFVSLTEFKEELNKHQDLSRTASAGMFKGGLADNKVETTRLHTAAHLLLAALRQVLSPEVSQKGSNITEERLRFDFNWPEKLTPEQIAEVEKIVNEKIKENISVEMEELSLEDAKKSGATGVFDNRYGQKVKVFTIGNFSKEICGGPHVQSTGELGTFKITKEESSSAGIRRIKAILEA